MKVVEDVHDKCVNGKKREGFEQILDSYEDECKYFEFKESIDWNDKEKVKENLLEELCALSNNMSLSHGQKSCLVVGITDEVQERGKCTNCQKCITDVSDKSNINDSIRKNFKPMTPPNTEVYKGDEFVIIFVGNNKQKINKLDDNEFLRRDTEKIDLEGKDRPGEWKEDYKEEAVVREAPEKNFYEEKRIFSFRENRRLRNDFYKDPLEVRNGKNKIEESLGMKSEWKKHVEKSPKLFTFLNNNHVYPVFRTSIGLPGNYRPGLERRFIITYSHNTPLADLIPRKISDNRTSDNTSDVIGTKSKNNIHSNFITNYISVRIKEEYELINNKNIGFMNEIDEIESQNIRNIRNLIYDNTILLVSRSKFEELKKFKTRDFNGLEEYQAGDNKSYDCFKLYDSIVFKSCIFEKEDINLDTAYMINMDSLYLEVDYDVCHVYHNGWLKTSTSYEPRVTDKCGKVGYKIDNLKL